MSRLSTIVSKLSTNAKNRHFYVPRPSFFVCPGDAPVTITQNVAWMKRQFSACQTPRSMYPFILNSFAVFRTASAKKRRFHVPQFTFFLPGVSTHKCLPVCQIQLPRSISFWDKEGVPKFNVGLLAPCTTPYAETFTYAQSTWQGKTGSQISASYLYASCS